MHITKYPQSNFLIEKDNTRILIDPGFLTFEKYKPADFGKLDAILATHRHWDHIDREPAKFWQSQNVPIYGNSDIVKVLAEENIKVSEIFSNQELEISNFRIKTVDIPHCKLLFCNKCGKQLPANELIPKIKKCKIHPQEELEKVDGPPNTGFLIDGILFHPGDGVELEGFTAENAFISINGPTVDFEVAWRFAKELSVTRIIPMHYSHPAFPADPVEFASQASPRVEVRILDNGESLEI